jgi:ABC-type antimicrobial peptide transport system permease subunit
MVLRETLALALLGLALGVPCALAASRLIASMLFGVSPSDLPTMAAVSLLLLIVALVAGYLPARRASRVDTMVALRYE